MPLRLSLGRPQIASTLLDQVARLAAMSHDQIPIGLPGARSKSARLRERTAAHGSFAGTRRGRPLGRSRAVEIRLQSLGPIPVRHLNISRTRTPGTLPSGGLRADGVLVPSASSRHGDQIGAEPGATIKIDDAMHEPGESARYLAADGGRIIVAVDAIFRVIEFYGACARPFARARGHPAGKISLPSYHRDRGNPIAPSRIPESRCRHRPPSSQRARDPRARRPSLTSI